MIAHTIPDNTSQMPLKERSNEAQPILLQCPPPYYYTPRWVETARSQACQPSACQTRRPTGWLEMGRVRSARRVEWVSWVGDTWHGLWRGLAGTTEARATRSTDLLPGLSGRDICAGVAEENVGTHRLPPQSGARQPFADEGLADSPPRFCTKSQWWQLGLCGAVCQPRDRSRDFFNIFF